MKTKALLPRYHFSWNGIPFPLWAVTGRPSGASKWFTPAARGREAASRPTPFHQPASLFGCADGLPCPVIAFAKYHIQAVPVCQEEIFRPARRVG